MANPSEDHENLADAGAPAAEGGSGGEYDDGSDVDSSEDEWAKPPPQDPIRVSERAAPPTDRVDGADDAERELAGERVPIDFHLPDGTVVSRTYRMGHTIQLLKAHLEDYHGLPYEKTTLKLGGMVCIDPLSLNDLPFKAEETNVVTVEVA